MSENDQNPMDNLNPNSHPEEGNGPDTGAADEVKKLQEEIEKQKKDFLYLRAEFENYKRHAVKERSDLLKYAGERLARDLLTVVDNFERALAVDVTPDSIDNYKKGVELTARELKALLEKHGITEVESQDKPFDPNIHEALGTESSTSIPEGHVLRVFEKPYMYHDRLLRVGRVITSRKPEA